MQVSWIDANHLNALLAQIAPPEPCVDEEPQAVGIQTAPEPAAGMFMDEDAMRATLAMGVEVSSPAPCPVVADELDEMPVPPVTAVNAETEAAGMLLEPGESVEAADTHYLHAHNEAAALPLARIRDKLRAIRQRATAAGILVRANDGVQYESVDQSETTASEQVEDTPTHRESQNVSDDAAVTTSAETSSMPETTQTPVFEIPAGSRDERLAAFATWARQVLHEDGGHVLVMSDDGEVLWGGEAKAGLVLSAMMAWGSAIRASALSACGMPPVIRQSLASGHVLTVIPCETSAGIVHAAVAAPAALSDEIAAVLRGALCAAMNAATA